LVLLGDDHHHAHLPHCTSFAITRNRKQLVSRPSQIPRNPGTTFRAQRDQRRHLPPAHHVIVHMELAERHEDQPVAIGNRDNSHRYPLTEIERPSLIGNNRAHSNLTPDKPDHRPRSSRMLAAMRSRSRWPPESSAASGLTATSPPRPTSEVRAYYRSESPAPDA
jgi:hypothetical protein